MNSNHDPDTKVPGTLIKRLLGIGLAVIALAAVALMFNLLAPMGGQADIAQGPTFSARKGRLTISVTESGTIKNREQVEIKSSVEGRTTVLFLVEEGSRVKKGELLVGLDTSKLEEQKIAQQITVLNSESSYVRARENLEVVKNQTAADVSKATLDYRFAQEDLHKYKDGDLPQLLNEARSRITIAEEELERARERLEWSKTLRAEKYISENELQADALSWKRAELDLELSRGQLDLLEKYTAKRRIDELESNIEQMQLALERAQLRARADVVQAEAELEAREQENERQKTKLQKTLEQITSCRITSPVDGLVVYASTGRGGYRGNEQPLEEGQEVHERQELLYLPTADSMMAEIKIHESSLDKVTVGMPVRVTVDAVPDRAFRGRVAKIGLLPDAQSSWLNPDLKVYTTEINLEEDARDLRAGMSCRAEILIDELADAVYVPVQSVLRVKGQPTVYLHGPKGPVAKTIEIGLDNNRMVHVKSGLTVGEEVLLAPPLAPSSRDDETESLAFGDTPFNIPELTKKATGRREEYLSGREDGPPADRVKTEGGSGMPDFSKMSAEERRKQFENMSDEDKQKLMERMRQMGGQGGEGGGPPRQEGGRRRGEGENRRPGERGSRDGG